MSSRRFKQIAHAFKEMELQLKSLYLIENENGRTEISVTLKGKGKIRFPRMRLEICCQCCLGHT